MPAVALKKDKENEIAVVKKMRNYSDEPVFKKKAEKAAAFIKKTWFTKDFYKKRKNRIII